MFLYLLIYAFTNPSSVPPKYSEAVVKVREASYKQTGAESDFMTLESKGNEIVKKNGLETPVKVVSAVAPVIMYKKIRVKERNFVFEGNKDKVQATWTFQF